MISIDELKREINYNPETGLMTRKKKGPRSKAEGKRAGWNHSGGYIQVQILGHKVFAHQVAWLWMTGEWPRGQIDHINGSRNDNRWSNLRATDQRHNSANMRRRANNKSGFKGVTKNKRGKYIAYIHADGKTRYLGSHHNPQDAHEQYVSAARAQWGDFARAE